MIISPFMLIGAIFRLLIPIAIFAISFYYLTKKNDTTSTLLAVGSFFNLIGSLAFSIASFSTPSNFNSFTFVGLQSFSYIGNIVFAIGFFMLIRKIIYFEE